MASAPTIAVGAIVIRDGHLLMVQRGRRPAKGLWSLPGGRVERGEYLADAITREVLEETGLEVRVGDLVGIHEVLGDDHFVILDYFAAPTSQGEPVAADDVMDARWVPFDEVVELDCTPRFVEILRNWGVLPT